MQRELLDYIRCPICESTTFDVIENSSDLRELREGSVVCSTCNVAYPVSNGILDLMPEPTQGVLSEQIGWQQLLGETSDALNDTMLKLPYLDDGGPWETTYHNFDAILQTFDVTGKTVLDIGAGRCWSTWRLKLQGAKYALALDILRDRYIGLETSDLYLDSDNVYFEQLIGDMNSLPLQSSKFDVVFMTATLHHTSDPSVVLLQVADVLVDGGTAMIINEPVRSPFTSADLGGCVEVQHGINENVYTIAEYMHSFKRAGLQPRLYMPASSVHALEHDPNRAQLEMGRLGYRIMNLLWRSGLGRKLLQSRLLKYAYLFAGMPLMVLAKKL